MASATIAAVRAEAAALANVAAGLTEADLTRSTPCPPWTVADLLGHVIIAVRRIGQAVAGPDHVPSGEALVTATGYYRPDQRFSAAVNHDRIAAAQALAARLGSAAAIAAALDRSLRDGCRLLEQGDRIIRTRHGDWMRLTEFARTRVVELGVHGLDVAAGLGREPWLTPQAAEVLTELLLPAGTAGRLCASLGIGRAGLIARLTGRASLSAAEQELLRGIEMLPLG
ncbi:MAG: maleylpyruvate isomerase family mycothiol-dependent enzyme [Streptosporangiaceae bacterium]